MKLAITTEDGAAISRHFGRAPYYLVVEIDSGRIVSQELRSKAGHNQFVQEGAHDHDDHDDHDHDHDHGHSHEHHGFGRGAQDRHARMFTPIADCQVVICGGMGAGAYQFLQSQGLQPIVTELDTIPAAVEAFLAGRLANRTDWLH